MMPLSRMLNPGIVSVPIGICSGIMVTLFFSPYGNFKSYLAATLSLLAIAGFVLLVRLFYKISIQFVNDLKSKEPGMHKNDVWRKAEDKVFKKRWVYKLICFTSILFFLISVTITAFWRYDFKEYSKQKEKEYINLNHSLHLKIDELKEFFINQNVELDSSYKNIQDTLQEIFKHVEKQNYNLNQIQDSLTIINSRIKNIKKIDFEY